MSKHEGASHPTYSLSQPAEKPQLRNVAEALPTVSGEAVDVRVLVDDLFRAADAGAFAAMHKICDAADRETK